MYAPPLEIQGHRGARGRAPENTLVSFEVAFDHGVTAIETDLHLTADGVPVIFHDPAVTPRLCSLRPGAAAPPPAPGLFVRDLTAADLRNYRVDRNPYPADFPAQDLTHTPLAAAFAAAGGLDPLGLPTLAELFAFAAAYAGDPGRQHGKTPAQQARVRSLRFDLELKRTAFFPEWIGDGFDGSGPAALEQAVVDAIRAAGVAGRTTVRSFDHRCVQAVKALAPELTTAVLIGETTPVDPVALLAAASADLYCPDFRAVDPRTIQAVQRAGKRIIPWTVNRRAEWERLIAWGVDGLTTDFPGELMAWLYERGHTDRVV